MVVLLGKRVFQRGSAVTDPAVSERLGSVQVSQRHIIKGGKNGKIHTVSTADRERF